MTKAEIQKQLDDKHTALQKACKFLNNIGKCPPKKNSFCPSCSANKTLRFYCWIEWAETAEET